MPESTACPLPPARDHLWLPKSTRSPALARRQLRAFLPRVRGGECFAEKGELLVSEPVTNAVVHGTRAGNLIKVVLELDAELLWITVEDISATPPAPRTDTDGESGRGLLLVDALAKEWGWGPRDGDGWGKRVWAC